MSLLPNAVAEMPKEMVERWDGMYMERRRLMIPRVEVNFGGRPGTPVSVLTAEGLDASVFAPVFTISDQHIPRCTYPPGPGPYHLPIVFVPHRALW
nr:hypothetical protein CFP56_10495 [Quercus suber]